MVKLQQPRTICPLPLWSPQSFSLVIGPRGLLRAGFSGLARFSVLQVFWSGAARATHWFPIVSPGSTPVAPVSFLLELFL